MVISNIKKEPSGHFLCETEDTPKYVAYVLGGAVLKNYRQRHYYDTPKYAAHLLGGAVSKRYRRLPKTEIIDTL